MAKLWRKRNMHIASRIKELQEMPYIVENAEEEIKKLRSQRITHREAPTFYSSEVATPSRLVYLLIYGPKWEQIIAETAEGKALMLAMYDAYGPQSA